MEKELRNVYVCACELLRHFWRSFPPTTPQLEEKAIRMHESLHRFHSAKLKPFEVRLCTQLISCFLLIFTDLNIISKLHFQDRVQREFSAVSQHLTSHLNQLLTAAYGKFAMWQQRRMQMR